VKKRLKNALVMMGVLLTFDLAQGIVFTSFGKSDGTFKRFMKNLRIPPQDELARLVPIAIISSAIVGFSTDYIRERLGLGCIDSIDDVIEVFVDELGE